MSGGVSRITENFVRLLSAITPATLPAAAIAAAQRLILDGLAVAVAGSREQAPRLLAEHFRELGGTAQASVIGQGWRTSIVGAAYINGAAMHVLDYEPMWLPPNHALSTTLPPLLALAEYREVNGIEIIVALVRGIEAQGRLRVASGQYEPRDLIFHPPGVVGGIGAAVGASALLGLNLETTCHALGIAASGAAGLLANVGTMTKSAHCGAAAATGLNAALLAARGFTANPNIIEADQGFAAGFFADDYASTALTTTDQPLRIMHPGYATKLFPSQYATHFAIVAALEARNKIVEPNRIASVTIAGPRMPYIDRPRPVSGLDGKFSVQYTTASALLDGRVTIDTFTDEACARTKIVRLLELTSFRQLQEIPAALDTMRIELTVKLTDDATIMTACQRPPAAWGEAPAIGDHLAKVRDCISRVFDDSVVDQLVAAVDSFDRLTATDVKRLMELLRDAG